MIVNMGWDQAETGMEGDSGELFAAAKGAVMTFSRSLALSFAPKVRVNCLAPGWVRTAWGQGASAVWQERVRRETPLAPGARPKTWPRRRGFWCRRRRRISRVRCCGLMGVRCVER